MSADHVRAWGSTRLLNAAFALNRAFHRLGLAKMQGLSELKSVCRSTLLKVLSAGGDVVPASVKGHTLFLPDRFLQAYLLKPFEPLTSSLFCRTIRPGALVLDIGAHLGYYTLLASEAAGFQGEVIAFEPGPDNFRLLERTIVHNGCTNVRARRLAIAEVPGQRLLHLSESSDAHSFFLHPFPNCRSHITCETDCASVDSILAGRIPDVVKIDVEGAELAALAGMRETMARASSLLLFIELNPACLRAAGRTPAELFTVLFDAGFSIQLLDEVSGRTEEVRCPTMTLPVSNPFWFANLYCVKGNQESPVPTP